MSSAEWLATRRINIPLLSSIEDFPRWSQVIGNLLVSQGVWHHLAADALFREYRDSESRRIILDHLSYEILPFFKHLKSSHEIWTSLKLSYDMCLFQGRRSARLKLVAYDQIARFGCCRSCKLVADTIASVSLATKMVDIEKTKVRIQTKLCIAIENGSTCRVLRISLSTSTGFELLELLGTLFHPL
jgi:hypothetical protein